MMGGVGAGREPVQGPPCLGAPSSGPSLLCPRGTHKPLMDFCWPACPQGAGLLLGAARPGPPLLLPSAHDKELQREHRSSLLQVLRNKRVPVSLRTMPLPHRVAGPSEHQCSPPGPGPKPPLSSSVLAALPPLSCCPFGLGGWRE